MSTHTPGPWEIADLAHGLIVRTESLRKSKYGASRYAAIGGFDRSDPQQFAEALANARLIAAAPDLLEALGLLLNDVGRASSLPGAVLARAAIKKATEVKP